MSIRLDINTNGAWRTVIGDINASRMTEIAEACTVIVRASVKPNGSGGIKFRRFCTESMKVMDYCEGSEGIWYEPTLVDPQQ